VVLESRKPVNFEEDLMSKRIEYSEFYKWTENTRINPQIEIPCTQFLYENGLTETIESYIANNPTELPYTLYSLPVNKASQKTKEHLDSITKSVEKRNVSVEKVWNDYRNVKDIVRTLDYNRMPSDSIAFYRPFHLEPFDEWGIYIDVVKLLNYCKSIVSALKDSLFLFNDVRDVLSFVLFEVFHHEFFHHIVECAATSIEIITANTSENVRPFYIDYLNNKYKNDSLLGAHPDDPIEEALANAYAYNSLSFLSRVQFGYKKASVDAYQRVLKKVWHLEPAGYCYAEKYINADYKVGATLLMAQIFCELNYMTPEVVGLVSQSVLLKGHSAFVEKGNIPVYLVGNTEALTEFDRLIPAPNETYTSLFMAHIDKSIDSELQKLKEASKRKTK